MSSSDLPVRPKIGLWWSEKKRAKLNVDHLRELFLSRGFQLAIIDLDRDIVAQGPFEAIIHKLSDIIVRAGGAQWWAADELDGDSHRKEIDQEAAAQLNRFKVCLTSLFDLLNI